MKILFATDGSESARQAQQFLAALPLPAGSRIQVVTVVGDVAWQVPDWVSAKERAWAEQVLREAAAALAREGVEVVSAVRQGATAGQILAAADEFDAALLVVGSQGLTGVAGFLLGSIARNVAKHARRPVLIARAPTHGLRQVVLAVDGSGHAAHAVKFAARLPLPAETEFTVAHVIRPYRPPVVYGPEYLSEMETLAAETRRSLGAAAEQLVAAACSRLAESGRHASSVVRDGDPAQQILELAAEKGADLIVAGARGASVIQGLIVGSVADRLLKTARCSVLIVH